MRKIRMAAEAVADTIADYWMLRLQLQIVYAVVRIIANVIIPD
jgi:hypothetical protein